MNPIDAAASSAQTSFPSPPPWYKEFTSIEDVQRRQPPPLPERTYTCFGWPRIAVQSEKTGIAAVPPLDSDTKLFSNVDDLRGEFKRLFKLLIDAMLKFIDQLAQTGHPGGGSAGSSVRTIMKLHKNLQHILVLLRYWEAREEVVQHFERQLKSRRQLIEALVSCLSPDPGDWNQTDQQEKPPEQQSERDRSDTDNAMGALLSDHQTDTNDLLINTPLIDMSMLDSSSSSHVPIPPSSQFFPFHSSSIQSLASPFSTQFPPPTLPGTSDVPMEDSGQSFSETDNSPTPFEKDDTTNTNMHVD